ncbi:radical SAM protein [Trichloromonas sp.]|uniref:radical SAM protein n=1 Tax=Trichloromonas sp. TaxID=3069249 RepID=UPI003D816818
MSQATENTRFLVPLADGLSVEAVYYGSGTLCISSQAGCAVGCPFCASGSRGLLRNLSAAEMWQQVEYAWSSGYQPLRVTISGIGEPLHNFPPMLAFMGRCRDVKLPVSLTTTGGPLARFREALQWPHNGLMLSLHAGTSATHRELIPHAPPLDGLLEVLEQALATLSRRRRRKVGINYLLLQGVNDERAELLPLIPLFHRFPELTLHLLTCNPVADSVYVSPPAEKIDELHAWLAGQGVHARRPNPWRTQQFGGCGTLFVRSL